MRGLVRLLVMFGPMIMNQITRYQRNKQRQQPRQRQQPYPQQQRGVGEQGGYNRRGAPQQQPQGQQPQQKVYKDLNKELGRDGRGRAVSAEERDFNLKEEDIMLNKEDLKHYEANNRKVEQMDDVSLDDALDKPKGASQNSKEDDSDYDEFFEA